VLALHILALQSLIKYGIDPAFLGQAIAIGIGGPIGFLVSQVQDSVAAAGGFSNMSAPTQQNLAALSQTTMTALAPYQTSPNPVISSPASDAAARVQAIGNLMTAAQPAIAVVQTINPNLVSLAAVYYSNAAMWRTIAAANGLSDPQPTGSFALVIPQLA
jgi:hypothetical protein